MSESGRRYSDREMAVILRLATESETRALREGAPAGARGHSLAEIEEIGAGAGIAAGSIRAAAAALEAEEPGVLARVLGGPTLFRIERFVPGAVEPGDLGELIKSVPWLLARDGGDIHQSPEGVGWRHKTDEGPLTHVELTRSGHGTRIRLLAQYEDPGAWSLIGAGALTTLGSFAAIALVEPSLAVGAGMIAGIGASSLLATRVFWRNATQRVRRRFTGLMDRLERQAAELATDPVTSPSLATPAEGRAAASPASGP